MKYLFLFVAVFFLACSSQQEDETVVATPEGDLIAISWYYKNSSYQKWLSEYDDQLRFVNIYDLPDSEIDEVLVHAHGFVLTGGCDVDPTMYGKAEEVVRCGKLDSRRDSLELLMVNRSFELNTPILGVCRGLQMMNVAAGGNLIIDLPSDRSTLIHQKEGRDVTHEVLVDSTKYFHEMTNCLASMVTSNHHQAIGRLGAGYEIQAYSPDSIIEAIWYSDTTAHPFALGVQWHPERMPQRDPLAGNIARAFLKHASLQSRGDFSIN